MSWLSKGAKKVTSSIGGILGGKTRNPYQSVDLSALDNMSQFDYLKDYASKAYAPVKAQSESLFQDYIKGIQSGYSTEDQQLQNLIRDIGRETDQAVGSSKLDYLDRGLGGPGQMSDIEAIGLAQTRGKGQELADSARLGVLSGREKTMADAYGQRYQTGTALGTQEASSGIDLSKYLSEIINSRNLAKATGQLTNASNYAANSKYEPGLFETMLRGFGNNAAEAAGKKVGSSAGTSFVIIWIGEIMPLSRKELYQSQVFPEAYSAREERQKTFLQYMPKLQEQYTPEEISSMGRRFINGEGLNLPTMRSQLLPPSEGVDVPSRSTLKPIEYIEPSTTIVGPSGETKTIPGKNVRTYGRTSGSGAAKKDPTEFTNSELINAIGYMTPDEAVPYQEVLRSRLEAGKKKAPVSTELPGVKAEGLKEKARQWLEDNKQKVTDANIQAVIKKGLVK